jgi:protein-disulfide isomerase-like protein with CxxC motif
VPLAEYQRRRGELERRQQELEQQARHLEAQADRQNELATLADAAGAFCERVRQGLAGFETMAMIRKGQVQTIGGNDIRAQASVMARLFQMAA